MNSSVISISNIAWDIDEDDSIAELLVARKVLCIDVAPGKYIRTYPDFDQDRVLRIRKWWNSRGIEIIGMQGLLFGVRDAFLFENQDTRENLFTALKKSFGIAKLLGAKRLVFGSPKNRRRGSLNRGEANAIARDFFCRVGDMAHAYGVCLCIEPNPREYGCDFLVSSEEAGRLVEDIDHPSVKMQFDSGACILNGESFFDVLTRFEGFVGHAHLSEPNLVEVGSIDTNHLSVATAIKKSSYRGPLTIEMLTSKEDRLVKIEKSLAYVQKTYV